ncbi:hypothetical protein BJV82DRAFT_638958 [Fennellomyces sp. T-0311]|nr:hypothetical protein BJV82DRAFT_638958 [Fennellomyces sp. T-0311]
MPLKETREKSNVIPESSHLKAFIGKQRCVIHGEWQESSQSLTTSKSKHRDILTSGKDDIRKHHSTLSSFF